MNDKKLPFLEALYSAGFKPGDVVTRPDIKKVVEANGLDQPWWFIKPEYRSGRGKFLVPESNGEPLGSGHVSSPAPAAKDTSLSNVLTTDEADKKNEESFSLTGKVPIYRLPENVDFTPKKVKHYVRWGHGTKIKKILDSKKFFPVFVTGLSGNGKTFMVEQETARAGREFFRVNITSLTDEDDLIGGFRLINGDSVFVYGPVTEAMMRGGVLLLDEIDLGTEKLMCLQPVLEGKPIFVKAINTWVYPKEGFQVMATGNTKGQGDETDKFVGTNVMNEATLERFNITLEQPYANESTETKILNKVYEAHGEKPDSVFVETLTKWGKQIRDSYLNGASDHVITTRRLVMILEHQIILGGDYKTSVGDCITRFDDVTQTAMMDIFKKLLPDAKADEIEEALKEQNHVEESEEGKPDEDGYNPF